MGYDPLDAEREEAYDRFVEEVSETVVEQFALDQMRSYYLQNSDLPGPAVDMLKEAQALLPRHASASLVFAVSASEICATQLILKPIVYGLVHEKSVANFVSNIVADQRSVDRHLKTVRGILPKLGIDLERRAILLSNYRKLSEIRNGIVHSGRKVTREQAKEAVVVATEMIDGLFQEVLGSFQLYCEPLQQSPPVILDRAVASMMDRSFSG